MALRMMETLRRQAEAEFGSHDLLLTHRLGMVPAEEVSILISVRTRHSAAAFEICHWYLRQVKQTVPIWKHPVALTQ
jgi:molybdopterin synthase catalytic subunit